MADPPLLVPHMTEYLRAIAWLAAVVVVTAACSGSTPDTPPASPPLPTAPSPPAHRWPLQATIMLTPDGVQPGAVTINVGGRVTFVNNDTVAHEIVSDPYLRHEDCPSINRVGLLAPGQQGDSAIFESVRDCGFHDHLNPTTVTGRVEVRIE